MTNDPCDFANNNFSKIFSPEDYKIFENCSFKDNASDFSSISRHKKAEIAFQFLFNFVASVGNCLLLFVMYKDPLKRLRNSTSYFIINLTFADLLSTTSGITETVIQLNPQDPKASDIQEDQKLAACIYGIGIQCSLLMIMIFSLDRYIAIAHAYAYRNIVGKKYIVVSVIFLPWCFAIITLPVMYFASFNNDVHELLTRMLAGNFIALSCITLTVHPYTHWVFVRRIKDLRNSSSNHKQLLEENLKVAKVLATTVLVVSICLIIFILPYFVSFCFYVARCDKCFLSNTFLSFWPYYPLLSSIRVTINSVVYAWRLPLYRKSLKAIFAPCGTAIRTMPGNRIHNFPLHLNIMNCSKRSSNTGRTSTKTQSESASYEDSGTVEKSNDAVLQPMALSNIGYNQAETYN